MLVTLPGIDTEVKLLQSSNTDLSMVMTLLGMVTAVILRNSLNAAFPIAVTVNPLTSLGMFTTPLTSAPLFSCAVFSLALMT